MIAPSTVVAIGPFDDVARARELAAAFTIVRERCNAQLVLLGAGAHRATVMRRVFARGTGPNVHMARNSERGRAELVSAADVLVASGVCGSAQLLKLFAAGRPVVTAANPTTVRLIMPNSAGLVYQPGDVTGMAGALLRLLRSPDLRHGMAYRAMAVAHREHMYHPTVKGTMI
jgi:glycosyltransferase involved in cell wall biosynthesis